MIIKKYEEWKPVQAYLGLVEDGMPGPKTLKHLALRLGAHEVWSHVQAKLGVESDGVPGPKTARAAAQFLGVKVVRAMPSETMVRDGSSQYGKAGDESNLVTITLPYPVRLSWDLKTTTTKLRCHKLVADQVYNIFSRTLAEYGLEKVQELGLDIYGGCYNNRAQVGGSKKSMHAWGIAIDLDPDKNALKMNKKTARLARPEYDAFWAIVEGEGGYSLGREKDFDWMHFQFARR